MRALILAIISGVKAASPSLSRLARKYSSKGSSHGKRDGDEERDDDTDREDGYAPIDAWEYSVAPGGALYHMKQTRHLHQLHNRLDLLEKLLMVTVTKVFDVVSDDCTRRHRRRDRGRAHRRSRLRSRSRSRSRSRGECRRGR